MGSEMTAEETMDYVKGILIAHSTQLLAGSWDHAAEIIANDLCSQSARIAYLEAENASLQLCDDEGICSERQNLINRVNELEEAARWKSCYDEPPPGPGTYLSRGSDLRVAARLYDPSTKDWVGSVA